MELLIPVAVPVTGFIMNAFGRREPIRNERLDKIEEARKVSADARSAPAIVSKPIEERQHATATSNIVQFDHEAGRGSQPVERQGPIPSNSMEDDSRGMPLSKAFVLRDQNLMIGGQGYDDESLFRRGPNDDGVAVQGTVIANASGGYVGKPLRTARHGGLGIQKPPKRVVEHSELFGDPQQTQFPGKGSAYMIAQRGALPRFQGQTVPRNNDVGQAFATGDEMTWQRSRGKHTYFRPPVAHETRTHRGIGDRLGAQPRTVAHSNRRGNGPLEEVQRPTNTREPDVLANAGTESSQVVDRSVYLRSGMNPDIRESSDRMTSRAQAKIGFPVDIEANSQRILNKIDHTGHKGGPRNSHFGQETRPDYTMPRATQRMHTSADLNEHMPGKNGPSAGVRGRDNIMDLTYESLRQKAIEPLESRQLKGGLVARRNVNADVGSDRVNIGETPTMQRRVGTMFSSVEQTGVRAQGAMNYAQDYTVRGPQRPVILADGYRFTSDAQIAPLRDNPLRPQGVVTNQEMVIPTPQESSRSISV